MSLLSIVQDATDRLGIPRPTQVIGTADTQVRQLLGLAQQEGKELANRHDWQGLTKETTFSALAQEVQTNALPADFSRMIQGTFYNRTRTRVCAGPLTPQEYADYKGRLTSIVYDAFRIRGSDILILPTPAAGWTFAFEYVSSRWAQNAAGTTQAASWQADDDTGLIDEEAMTLGVIWRFLKAKGLDYGEAFRQYEDRVKSVFGRDGTRRTLNMAMSSDRRVPRAPLPPDGSWNL